MSKNENPQESFVSDSGGRVVNDNDEGNFEGNVPWRDTHEENLISRQAQEDRKAAQYAQNERRKRKTGPRQSSRGRGMHDVTREDSASLSAPRRHVVPSEDSASLSSPRRGAVPSQNSASSTGSRGPLGRSSSSGLPSITASEGATSSEVGAFAVAGVGTRPTAAGSIDVEAGDYHTTYSERPETVVAQAVTTDDLANQIREELRSEIRQELQVLQRQAVSAEVVAATATHSVNDTTAHSSSSNNERPPFHEGESKPPFWKRKCFIVVAVLLLIAVVGGVVGAVVGAGGGGGGGDDKSDLTDNQSVSPEPVPTMAPVNNPTDEPVEGEPTVAPTPPPTPSGNEPNPPSPPSPAPTPAAGNEPTLLPTPFPTPPPTLPPTTIQGEVSAIQTIRGAQNGDDFGTYVEFSRDGTTMAVGASGANQVRVYRQSGGQWSQIGQTIGGSGSFGSRLDLNQDGSILVVGAWNNDDGGNNAGQAQVFKLNGSNQWINLGQDLNGKDPGDRFGWDVAIADDGMTIAVSGRLGDPSSDRTDAGYVQAYSLNQNSQWVQLGPDLEGEASADQFGRSVAMSSDGLTVAVGAVRGGGGTGRIRVFGFSGGTWNPIGQPLDGEANEDFQGTSIALSSSGTILAIAADGNDTNGDLAGLVRVYVLSGGTWMQRGQNLFGEGSGDQFGAGHISLSSDGNTLAVGAQHNDNDRGEAYLFRFNGSSQWMQIAEVSGDSTGDLYGDSVNVSGDGSLFAVGGPLSRNSPGYVRVFSVT